MRATSEDIHNVKFKNEKLQKESRLDEESRRQERYNEIQTEAISSGKRNAALEMKWAELKEYEECEELNKAIDDQKSIFQIIVEGKDKLIKEFWDELKKKDDDYVKMLKEHSSDIETMIINMRKQFFDIR